MFNKTEEVEQILNIKEVPTTLETQQVKVIWSNICDNRPKNAAVSQWEIQGGDWIETATTKPTCMCMSKHLKIHPKSIP